MNIAIGIDPGVDTGIAVWDIQEKELKKVSKVKIHKAMELVFQYRKRRLIRIVRVEDARKRKWYGENAGKKIKGAGSIERDCKIWEDFLKDNSIPFELVHPIEGATKWSHNYFKQITEWEKQTNQDARDAALLVYDYKSKRNLKANGDY